jgi:hypothetical protein
MIEKIGRQFQRKRSPANFVTLACRVPDSNRTGDCRFAVATQSEASAMVNVARVIATAEYFFIARGSKLESRIWRWCLSP